MRPRRPSPASPAARDTAERPPATLADLQAAGLPLFCWCNRCCHNAVLPLEPLLARLGQRQAVPLVGRHLVCSACGSKDIATRPHWKDLGEATDGGTKDDHTVENEVLAAGQA